MLVVDLPAPKSSDGIKQHNDCFSCGVRQSCRFYVDSEEAPCVIKGTVEEWLASFNTESATACFTAIQELKKQIGGDR